MRRRRIQRINPSKQGRALTSQGSHPPCTPLWSPRPQLNPQGIPQGVPEGIPQGVSKGTPQVYQQGQRLRGFRAASPLAMPQLRWGGTMGAGSAPSFSSSLGTSCSLTAEHIQLRFSHPRITHTLQPHSSLTHWTSHTNRSPAGPAGPCTRGRSTPSLPLSLSLTPLCHTVSANSACSARIQQLGSLGSPCTTATTTSAGKNSSRMYSSRSRTSISNRMFVASSTSRISSGSSSALLTRIPLTSSRSLHPRTPTALPSLGNHPSQAQSNTPRSNPRSTLRSTPWSPLGPATRLTPRSTPGARPAVHVRGLQQNAKGGSTPGTSGEGDSGAPSTVQILFRKTVRNLASLPLAIGLLFAIAGTCALGKWPPHPQATFIPHPQTTSIARPQSEPQELQFRTTLYRCPLWDPWQ